MTDTDVPAVSLAGALLSAMARHRAHAAAVDADRRQGAAGADAVAEPRLARAALRQRARPRHVADPHRARHASRSTSTSSTTGSSSARRTRADGGFALEPMSVAAFYRRCMQALAAARHPVAIDPMPNEVPDPIRFADDEVHARLRRRRRCTASGGRWSQADRVFQLFRTGFLGKSSPVHFFWGSFDLAVTRFSGRPAPPHPGGVPGLPDASRARPIRTRSAAPASGRAARRTRRPRSTRTPIRAGRASRRRPVEPAGAAGRRRWASGCCPTTRSGARADPDAALLRFLETTYRAAAGRGNWPAGLECELGQPRGRVRWRERHRQERRRFGFEGFLCLHLRGLVRRSSS